MNQLISSFNSGELSPRLESRPDIEKYASGCRLLQNFLVTPYGGVNRRQGTDFKAIATSKTRVIGFNFSVSTAFILELGNLYCRFWHNREQVMSGDAPLQVATPYTIAELFEAQFTQINDIVIFVHPNHPPQKLSRLADNDWTWAAMGIDWPAVLDENTTDVTITPSGTSGLINLNASAPLFFPGHAGGTWQLIQRRNSSNVALALTGTATSAAIGVLGKWDFTTHGTWGGTISIERSKDGGSTWEVLRLFEANSDRNIAADGEELEECKIRLDFTHTAHSGTVNPEAYFDAYDTQRVSAVRITEVPSETMAVGMVIQPLESTAATKRWSESAWSEHRGFPRSVCLHEQRLDFGGTKHQPQTVWGSAIGDFFNFKLGANDDSAIAFTLASTETNPIQWMVSQRLLCIGTAADEFIVAPASDGAISPTNFQVKRQSHFGSGYLQATIANEAVLFVQRQGRKVREFVYNYQTDAYGSADLTMLADHITEGGIVQVAFQQQPDPILWCVTGKGTLIGMAYERSQNVFGWFRLVTDGAFESVATIYSANGADELWCVVRRTINGAEVRTIERFDVGFKDALESENKLAWHYLDCAKRVLMHANAQKRTTIYSGVGFTSEALTLIEIDLGSGWQKTSASGELKLHKTVTTIEGAGGESETSGTITIETNSQGTTGSGQLEYIVDVDTPQTVTSSAVWSVPKVTSTGTSFPNLVATSSPYYNPHAGPATVTITDDPESTDMDDDIFIEAFAANGTPIAVPLGPYVNGINHASMGAAYGDPASRYSVTINIPEGGWIVLKSYDAVEGQEGGTTGIVWAWTEMAPVPTPMTFTAAQYLEFGELPEECLTEISTTDAVYSTFTGPDLIAGSEIPEAAEFTTDISTEPDGVTVSGLEHLEGKTVSILADGAVHPDRIVSNGCVSLQAPASNVLVGLRYVSQLKLMPLDPGMLRDGTAQGRKFRINRAILRVYKSLGGEVEVAADRWDPVCYRSPQDRMDQSPPVFTGDKEIVLARDYEGKATVNIRQTQPLPLTLLAVIPKYEVSGD